VTAELPPPGQRLRHDVLDPLKRLFVGKDEIVDVMGVCLVAGENLFLLGPPGTAKTALVHALGDRLGGHFFEYLLTRFTEPNELFGPFDIRRLREGDLVTNTEGMMPQASLVFLDELLNANSAILNSLLTVLNERVLRRGRETIRVPALIFVGASNHLPEEDALRALFDRFLLRVACDNVPGEHLAAVLHAGWQLATAAPGAASGFTVDDVRRLQAGLAGVDIAAVRKELVDLVVRLRQAGIAISDRRAVKLQKLVAASALLCGRTAAAPSDLWVFRYIWDTVEQQEVLAAIVAESLRQVPPAAADHPRARHRQEPVAEDLAHDLDALAHELAKATPEARAAAKDRLGILASRCQWVPNETQRAALLERVDTLWAAAGVTP
jgi:MoxR-like ATPase